MTERDDHRLSELIGDAVADIEPADRLPLIRSRTEVTAMTTPRSWLLAAGGAIAAAAAVVVAVAVMGQRGSEPSPGPGPAASDTGSTAGSLPTPTGEASTSAPASPSTTPGAHAVAVYAIGDTPLGPRLYREFRVATGSPGLAQPLALIGQGPDDPDYRTVWPAGELTSARIEGDVIIVTLADASLRERPAGMSAENARLGVQQVVYTLQGAAQRRLPVQFRTADNPIDQVLGVPTAEPVVNDPLLDTLSLVSLSTPSEGDEVGDALHVSGVANSFEATVPWKILEGERVVDQGSIMAQGAYGTRLWPFDTTLDVSSLAAGHYTLVVSTDDPSGGEGPGPFVDTRTFTVE